MSESDEIARLKAKADHLEHYADNNFAEWEKARKTIAKLKAEINSLRVERCYICRPDDPTADIEGCGDCDQKAVLHQQIEVLQVDNERLVAALKRCRSLFSDIRGDWTDPRTECREGWRVIEEALKSHGEG